MVLTTGRQDWGILRPLCEAMLDKNFDLLIVAGGMACSPSFGKVSKTIKDLGFDIARELIWDVENSGAPEQSSRALELTADALRDLRPDALILLGDRFETAAAAFAATMEGVPVVHLYGGEETRGAFDDSLRHAITKMSVLHFVGHREYADRVIQMGERPETVHVPGYLSIDNIYRMNLPSKSDLEDYLETELESPLGLVTVHPVTLSKSGKENEIDIAEKVIRTFGAAWVITLPNADPGNGPIRERFLELSSELDKVVTVTALGEEKYLGLMKCADFVFGNSSSGMIEAPALGVPTINMGDRQEGRIRAPSVIDVPCDERSALKAVESALSDDFKPRLESSVRHFGGGGAAGKIVAVLEGWKPPRPPRKTFYRPAKY